ncbi:MAG: hypothetical protein KKF48_04260 [Nanoarchaeota archaeon]|nr:hypothetical protein [Nanoarchaeota archaeon]MBU1028232.1 hypothetical protein [Nanoarchaeota archaeon]
MKGMLVIIDGMGDLPNKQIGGMTPLEAAEMLNLDFLATRGEMGYMFPVKPGFIPESDEAIVSIFGNSLMSSTRGQLEAASTDLKIVRGDLALRVNFATIDSLKKGNIIDRRAGRTLTTTEAEFLAKDLNNKLKLPVKFIFEPTVQHRGVLIFRGGFSDNVSGNDATYSQGKSNDLNKIRVCKPLDDEENSQYTVNILNEFIEKSHEILNKHPINLNRKKRGLLPANYLFLRSPGAEIPKLRQYSKWISPSYMPLEIGFSKLSGMKVVGFEYPKLKNLDAYGNLWDGLKKECKFCIKTIKKYYKKYDYAYIHIKETDLPGHDNKPIEKKEMLEYIDKTFFKFLRGFVPQNKIKVVVTADHSTPCKLKNHSADPVPVLFYNDSIPKKNPFFSAISRINEKIHFRENKEQQHKGVKFCEKNARKGSLGSMMGNELLERVGFDK